MQTRKWIWAGIIVLALIGYSVLTYNGLISKGEAVDNSWAQVETQYQRRLDLIPNLVSSVKGVMAQEQKVFGDLAEARTNYSGAKTVDEKAAAATQVEGALGRLLVVMENYPVLKSSDNVQTLMAQLEGAENRVSVERQRFNDNVRSLNVTVKRFPTNLVAKLFSFSERPYFDSAEGAEVAPKVDLQN